MEENAVVAVEASAEVPGGMPPQTERVIAALLNTPNLTAAAAAVGLSAPTLWRLMRNPRFQEEYRDARRQIVSQAIAQVQQATGEAVEVLRSLIADTSGVWPRLAAARAIIQLAVKAIETEDFDARLAALEQAQKNGKADT